MEVIGIMSQPGRAIVQDDEEFFSKKALEMREVNLQDFSEQIAKGEENIQKEMGRLQAMKARLGKKMLQDEDPGRRERGMILLQEIGHS
jgi:hypothetical protein